MMDIAAEKPSISIFFPMYNDENTIELLIRETISVLEPITDDYEVIIIDDCSQDATGSIADRLCLENKRIKVVHHDQNRDYGGAVKSGLLHCSKNLIFYTDGDKQYDIKELKKFLMKIEEADVVTGYKIKRYDHFYRIIIGNIYRFIINNLFGLQIKDPTCDFRLFKREAINSIGIESNSGFVCIEMMKKIQDKGYKIAEVSVHHFPRAFGRSQAFELKRIISMFKDLCKQWVKYLRNGKL
jgi:glycosyltransferase involved in cell wall biosynthesis